MTARLVVPAPDFDAGLAFFTDTVGFRLDQISPADDPSSALLTGFGITIRLDRDAEGSASLELLTDDPALVGTTAAGPNGTQVSYVRTGHRTTMPTFAPSVTVSRTAADDANPGRAGMRYRDLVPDRYGGAVIASHIAVPGTGPVPDYVHHHDVAFQIIFCRRGAATLVYEDQGPPFRFEAGDCVVQPPHIRHRVLESFDDLEVVEVTCPAHHDTFVEHEITLPTATLAPDRSWSGQHFVHHCAAEATWQPWSVAGFEVTDTGIGEATQHVGGVRVIRPADAGALTTTVLTDTALTDEVLTHNDAFVLWFVLEGSATVQIDDATHDLGPADAITIPAGQAHSLSVGSADLQLLDVRIYETR